MKSSRSLVIAAFAAIYIIWGSTYLGIRLAIETIPPFTMACARFLIAGSIVLIWAISKGEKLPDTRSILKIALSGILMLFIGNGAVTWVEQYLPSGLVAIIVATVPLWLVLLDRRQWKYNFSHPLIIIGLLIGFGGVVLLFAGNASGDLIHDNKKLISLFVLVGGTISWAIGTLFSKYSPMAGSTLMKVAIQTIAAGIVFLPATFISGEQAAFHFSNVSGQSLLALAYLVIMGSIVGYLAYIWLLSVRPASLVGTYAYVNPVVAVLLGWLVVDERITTRQGLGLAIVLVGLIVINLTKDKQVSQAKE